MVAGVGGGKFAPEDQVTGFQAAKMLLVALGYEAERENFNTPMWETNVSVRAAQAGLFQGLDDLNPSAPLSRDSAAQMIWNALNAGEVEYVTQTVTEGQGYREHPGKAYADQGQVRRGRTPCETVRVWRII